MTRKIGSTFPFHDPALLAPWSALGTDAAAVIAMRLAWMPWLLATDAKAADREANLMLSEKREAVAETMLTLWQAPFLFWSEALRHSVTMTPMNASLRALNAASGRAAAPSSRRVKANRKRLSRGAG